MSVSDIEEQIREVYDFEVSSSTISRITSAITNEVVTWQNRPLEDLYLIVWMDGIVLKFRKLKSHQQNYLSSRRTQPDGKKKYLECGWVRTKVVVFG